MLIGKLVPMGECYPEKAPKVDELLQTLSNSIRREIIHYFENHNEGTMASLEELVAHIDNRMPTKTTDELWVTLYQAHLPKLQSKGWLEFDTRSDTITYHGHHQAEQLLREVHGVFND